MAEMADRVIHLSDGKISHIERNAQRRPVRSLQW
jgi:putative ABC transport system ATP-binding protein